jgi:hypothetical protein
LEMLLLVATFMPPFSILGVYAKISDWKEDNKIHLKCYKNKRDRIT